MRASQLQGVQTWRVASRYRVYGSEREDNQGDTRGVEDKRMTFTITSSCSPNGTITGSAVVEKNANAAFFIAPNLGYRIDYLLVDGARVNMKARNQYIFNNVISNHTITALFVAASYALTLVQPINGDIVVNTSVNLPNCPAGTVVTLRAVPKAGYIWTGWFSGNNAVAFGLCPPGVDWSPNGDNPLQNPIQIVMDGNKTIAAGFESIGFSTWFMAEGGNDLMAGTTTLPWATFAGAFKRMAAGDTLIVKDGTYRQALQNPNSGRSSQYTTIKAEHPFGATIDVSGITPSATLGFADCPLAIVGASGPKSYITVEGFRFKGHGDLLPAGGSQPIAVSVTNRAHHVKILKCGFSGGPTYGGNTCVNVGLVDTRTSFILLEDCHAFGGGRYDFALQTADHTILRRCVARHDRFNSINGYEPQAAFVTYWSPNALLENCLAIDCDQESLYTLEGGKNTFWSGCFFSQKAAVLHPNERMLGCVGLKSKIGVSHAGSEGVLELRDCTMWDMSMRGIGYTYQEPDTTPSLSINNCVVGKTPIGIQIGPGFWPLPTVRNSLITQCGQGLTGFLDSGCNNLWGNTVDYGVGEIGWKPKPGLGDTHADPQLKSLPVPLLRYGRDGTLWGEIGYDELTTDPLWPWPYEAEIKADMAAYDKRGFCADGQTLSNYVQQYPIGN
jgi:hypothetical protein